MVELQSKNEDKTQNPIKGKFQKSTTLASMESLSMPEVQELVFLADFRSSKCQERVAEVISKIGEMQSVVVSVREKEVTLTCTNPMRNDESPTKIGAVYDSHRRPSSTKLALIMRLIFSTRS